jgi:hypothetical protein
MKNDPIAADERAAGMGGSYLVDKKTGATSLVHRTEDPAPESPAPAPAEAEDLPPPDRAHS